MVVNEEEKALLEAGGGRVVLFLLSGPMIVGVAHAIARKHAAVEFHAQVVVMDLTEVSILGTTVALALENVIRDALHAGRRVVVAGAPEEARDVLGRLGVLSGNVELTDDRLTALRDAVSSLGD